MLTYSFAEKGSDPLYEYLYKCMKRDILQGKLAPDEKLPSKRGFAKNLGISTITVENAYAQLLAEGYIYSIPKKGYYVQKIAPRAAGSAEEDPGSRAEKAPEEPRYFADFVSSETRPENFPFATWSRLMRRQLTDHQDALLANVPSAGAPALREAIARHLREFHGITADADQVVIGAGTEYLYGLLLQLLGLDRTYGVEDPGYPKIAQVYRSHGVRTVPIAMDESGVLPRDMEGARVDVMHISPSHHFPTGVVMPVSRRYELLGWAAAGPGRYIIEDDYDSELRLAGRPVPSLQSMDVQGRVIYMNTFTKSLASTIRISYMVLPRRLARAFSEDLRFYSCTVSNFEQYTLAAFIQEGYYEKHISRMRGTYRAKQSRILRMIRRSPLAERVTISGADAGLHFLMKIDTDLTDEEVERRAAARGVRLAPIRAFYADEKNAPVESAHTFVVNYSSVDDASVERAFDIIRDIACSSSR